MYSIMHVQHTTYSICSIMHSANIQHYAYSKSNMLEVFREGLFEYRYYLALINTTT